EGHRHRRAAADAPVQRLRRLRRGDVQEPRERAPVGVTFRGSQSPRKNAGHEGPALVLSAEPTSPSRGELAAAKSSRPGRMQRSLATAHGQYVGMRATLQCNAPHDSHVSVARLYADVTPPCSSCMSEQRIANSE